MPTNVTIPDELAEITFASVNGTGPLVFDFPWFQKKDLEVWINDALISINDWSVTPTTVHADGNEGGSVTLVNSQTAAKVTITRKVSTERLTDFTAAGARAGAMNTALDQIHAILRDLKTVAALRAIQLLPGDSSGPYYFPIPATRASKVPTFDDSGDLDFTIDRVDVATVASIKDAITALSDPDIVSAIQSLSVAEVLAGLENLADFANQLGLLGTQAAVDAIVLLGVQGVVDDMGLLATTANIANMAALADAGVLAAIAAIKADLDLDPNSNILNAQGNADQVAADLITVEAHKVAAEAAAAATQGSATAAANSATASAASATSADQSADTALSILAAVSLSAGVNTGAILGAAFLAKSRTTLAQPSTPANGDTYILPASGSLTGAAWSTYSNGSIARYSTSGGWFEDVPVAGSSAYVQDAKQFVIYENSAWGPRGSGGSFTHAQLVAKNATGVSENDRYDLKDGKRSGAFRATLASIATLVAADPAGGVAIPFSNDATGASGGFVREAFEQGGNVWANWFGLGNAGNSEADEATAILRAATLAGIVRETLITNKIAISYNFVDLPAGSYNIETDIIRNRHGVVIEGHSTTLKIKAGSDGIGIFNSYEVGSFTETNGAIVRNLNIEGDATDLNATAYDATPGQIGVYTERGVRFGGLENLNISKCDTGAFFDGTFGFRCINVNIATCGSSTPSSIKTIYEKVDDRIFTPPGSPANGDRYLINGGTATGAWASHDNEIAEWNGSSWDFTVPTSGYRVRVDDEKVYYGWNGAAWATSNAARAISACAVIIGGTASMWDWGRLEYSNGDANLIVHGGLGLGCSALTLANLIVQNSGKAGILLLACDDVFVLAGDYENNANGVSVTTFDPSTAVNTGTDVITINAHGFVDGDILVYSNGGGSNIGGLTNGRHVFVRDATANTFKLATISGGAAVDLTSVGSGTTHTLVETAPDIWFDSLSSRKGMFSVMRTSHIRSGSPDTTAGPCIRGTGFSLADISKCFIRDQVAADYTYAFEYTGTCGPFNYDWNRFQVNEGAVAAIGRNGTTDFEESRQFEVDGSAVGITIGPLVITQDTVTVGRFARSLTLSTGNVAGSVTSPMVGIDVSGADRIRTLPGSNTNGEEYLITKWRTPQTLYTFDGSSGSDVGTANDLIGLTGHTLVDGDKVIYSAGGGGAVPGLTDKGAYYVVSSTAGVNIKLAYTPGGTAINITGLGSGTAHTIQKILKEDGKLTITPDAAHTINGLHGSWYSTDKNASMWLGFTNTNQNDYVVLGVFGKWVDPYGKPFPRSEKIVKTVAGNTQIIGDAEIIEVDTTGDNRQMLLHPSMFYPGAEYLFIRKDPNTTNQMRIKPAVPGTSPDIRGHGYDGASHNGLQTTVAYGVVRVVAGATDWIIIPADGTTLGTY